MSPYHSPSLRQKANHLSSSCACLLMVVVLIVPVLVLVLVVVIALVLLLLVLLFLVVVSVRQEWSRRRLRRSVEALYHCKWDAQHPARTPPSPLLPSTQSRRSRQRCLAHGVPWAPGLWNSACPCLKIHASVFGRMFWADLPS